MEPFRVKHAYQPLVNRLLGYGGIRVVESSSEEAPCTLSMAYDAHPKGAYYKPKYGVVGEIRYYETGVHLTGWICLNSPGASIQKTFEAVIDPPVDFGDIFPVGEALKLRGSYLEKLLELIGEAYGPQPLISVIKEKHDADFYLTIKEATEQRAREVLVRMSGKDFGKDADQWEKWWKDQQPKKGGTISIGGRTPEKL